MFFDKIVIYSLGTLYQSVSHSPLSLFSYGALNHLSSLIFFFKYGGCFNFISSAYLG